MTSSIPVSWDTSIEHEALRILYYLKRLPELELQQRGFIILPRLPSKNSNNTIILPRLSYSSIPNLWAQVIKLNPTTPMTAPQILVGQIIKLFQSSYRPPVVKEIHIQPFLNTLFSVIPQYGRSIKDINIVTTFTGSVSQFNLITPNQKNLFIYLRSDATQSDLAQAIILSLIRHQLQYIEHRTWEEIEAIADFILCYTPIRQSLSSPHTPIISQLRQRQIGRLKIQSQRYLSSLGIPIQNNWTIKNSQIFYASTQITNLTQRQHLLLTHLLTHYSQVVTNDQIADILWPDGQNYSPWAIVKEIARIRQRLVHLGLPGSLIQSHRKLGYSLN